MNRKKLQMILDNHKRWLTMAGGERADLSRADLSRADLSGADLRAAKLSGAELSNADLSGANLRSANLSGADLYGADLSGADLSGTYLYKADLYMADLSGADLAGADLYGAHTENTCVFTFTLGRHSGFCYGDYIQIGCEHHEIKHWKKNYRTIGRKANYTADEIYNYGILINMLARTR